jgi:hypothetical protein
MSAERLTYAPQACLKGPFLLDVVGLSGQVPEEGDDSGTDTSTQVRYASKLDRWAAETSRRYLKLRDEEPEFFAVLVL